jgi:hypothetical protein
MANTTTNGSTTKVVPLKVLTTRKAMEALSDHDPFTDILATSEYHIEYDPFYITDCAAPNYNKLWQHPFNLLKAEIDNVGSTNSSTLGSSMPDGVAIDRFPKEWLWQLLVYAIQKPAPSEKEFWRLSRLGNWKRGRWNSVTIISLSVGEMVRFLGDVVDVNHEGYVSSKGKKRGIEKVEV